MAKLGDVFECQITGEWGKECTDNEVGTKVLRTTNFTSDGMINYDNVVMRSINRTKVEKKKLHYGDIILEKSGGTEKTPVGRVVFCDKRIEEDVYLCNNFTQAMRVNQSIAVPRYVFYFMWNLHCSGKTSLLQNKTTGIRNLQVKSYLNEIFPLPPLDEQYKIAMVLDKISDLIAKSHQQIKKLDELVKSRFIEMFGDPEINPYGWRRVTVEDVCSSIVRGPFGSTLKKEFFVKQSDNTYKVYEQKHAIQKSATIGTYYITAEKYNELRRFKCHPGDILMSCSGTMGELFQLPENCEKGIINQALCKFTLNEKILPIVFLVYMKETIGNLETKGSGIQNIAAVSYVKTMPINLAPMYIQNQFAAFVTQADKSKYYYGICIEFFRCIENFIRQEWL